MGKGKLIVLEGTDGSGKSTQFARPNKEALRDSYAVRVQASAAEFPMLWDNRSRASGDVSAGRFRETCRGSQPLCGLYVLRNRQVRFVQNGLG